MGDARMRGLLLRLVHGQRRMLTLIGRIDVVAPVVFAVFAFRLRARLDMRSHRVCSPVMDGGGTASESTASSGGAAQSQCHGRLGVARWSGRRQILLAEFAHRHSKPARCVGVRNITAWLTDQSCSRRDERIGS